MFPPCRCGSGIQANTFIIINPVVGAKRSLFFATALRAGFITACHAQEPPTRGGNIYALDTEPGLKPGLTKQELLQAMDGHVLAEGQLVGTYQRK